MNNQLVNIEDTRKKVFFNVVRKVNKNIKRWHTLESYMEKHWSLVRNTTKCHCWLPHSNSVHYKLDDLQYLTSQNLVIIGWLGTKHPNPSIQRFFHTRNHFGSVLDIVPLLDIATKISWFYCYGLCAFNSQPILTDMWLILKRFKRIWWYFGACWGKSYSQHTTVQDIEKNVEGQRG